MKTDKLVLISNIDRYIGAGIVKGMMLAGVITGRMRLEETCFTFHNQNYQLHKSEILHVYSFNPEK